MALTFKQNSPSELEIQNTGGKSIKLSNSPTIPSSVPTLAPSVRMVIDGTLYAEVPSSSYGGASAPSPVTYSISRSPASGNVNEGSAVSFTVTASDGSVTSYPYTVTGITSADLNPSGTSLSGTANTGSAVPFTIASDSTTEGTETMTFTIPSSYPGPTQSVNIGINDTSTTPGSAPSSFVVLGPFSAPYTTFPNSTAGINNVWFRRGIVRYNLTQSELNTAGLNSSTTLTKIAWNNLNVPTRPTQPNFTILLAPTINPQGTNDPTTTPFYNSPQTTVYGPSPYTWGSPGPTTFNFSTPYTYPGSNGLQVTVKWGQVSPNYASSGQMAFRGPGNMYYARTDSSGTYPNTNPTPQALNVRPITQFN